MRFSSLPMIALLTVCLATALPVRGQDINPSTQEAFFAGNIAYAQGDFAAAEAYFRKALQNAESAALHYNLANALAKQQLWALAAAHYLRAHALDPRLSDARGNLLLVQNRLGLRDPYPRLAEPASLLTAPAWTVLAAASFWIAAAAAFHRRICPWRLPLARSISAIALATFALSLFSLHQHQRFISWSVVLIPETTLRVAPTAHSPGQATLQAGQVARVLGHRNGFFHIRLPDGPEGFLLQDELAAISSL